MFDDEQPNTDSGRVFINPLLQSLSFFWVLLCERDNEKKGEKENES